MEDYLNETFTELSPPKRRLSTFFERRSIGTDNPDTRHTDQKCLEDIKKESQESEQFWEEELKKYYEQLLEEKSRWKLEVEERKAKCKELKLQHSLCSNSNKYAKRYNYSILSEEDIMFIKGKPNIAKTKENIIELAKNVQITMQLHYRLRELQSVTLDQCEQKSSILEMYILDNSSVE